MFLVFSLSTSDLPAQLHINLDKTTRFEKLSVGQGLSSRYTTVIHQDQYGFIWIGTQNGLNLYDGMEFKIFRSETENPNSLPSNYIYKIIEAKDSTIWICTEYGLSRFNRASEDFINFYPDTIDYDNPINSIREIYNIDNSLILNAGGSLYHFNINTFAFHNTGIEIIPFPVEVWNDPVTMLPDSSGILWVLSKEGQNLALCRYNCKNGERKKYLPVSEEPIRYSDLNVTSLFKVYPNILWIGTFGNGLYKLVVNENGFYTYEHFDRFISKTIITDYITAIFQDRNSNIWVGAKYGFYKLLDGGHSIPALSDKENIFYIKNYGVRDFSEDNSGCFWMTALDRIFCFNQQTKNLTYFMHDPENPTSLSGNHPFQAYTDKTDQTWILTENSGISRLNTYANSFLQVKKNSKENSLSNGFVTSFLVDSRGDVWIGTFGGGLNRTAYKEDHHFENFKHYFDPAAEKVRFSYYGNFEVGVIYEDKMGNIWVGTYDALNKYNPESDDFTQYRYSPEGKSSVGENVTTTIFEDHLGTFWVGTQGGLNIFDRETEEFHYCLPYTGSSAGIGGSATYTIYEDRQKNLWFGGKLLRKLVRKDTSFITYKTGANIPNNIAFQSIRVILEDNGNHLWLGTNKGLYKMDILEETYVAVSNRNGQQEDAISGMCLDDRGNLWISKATGGMSRYNTADETFMNFNTTDGLVDIEFVEGSYYKDKDGWMYFGGHNGFNVFHPDSIKVNTHIPPVYITAFSLFGERRYLDKPIFETKEIRLSYYENEFTFDFVALNYLNSKKNKYAYKLEGYEEDWNYTDGQRFASYTNMGPGDYIFRVKASNNDGYWNDEEATIALVILPPFWKTNWAYLVYTFLFIGIIYLLRRYEMNRLHYKQKLEINLIESEKRKELDIEKNKFFSNISHEFRTPLTLILGPLNKIIDKSANEEQKEELGLIRRNAQRLQVLINQLLSLSKLESGQMKLKACPENIVRLTRVLVESFQSMAEDREIKIDFECNANEYIVYIDALKYEKIVNNLLSNAFKFTERGGKIKVSVSPLEDSVTDSSHQEEPGGVTIKIADTGIGIRKEKLPYVFDRFYQVDEKQMRTNLGTGIGLALTKELVELHHGTINVDSESGMGTTFTLFFPAGKNHLSADEIFESSSRPMLQDHEFSNEDYLYVQDVTTKSEIKPETSYNNKLPLLLIVEDNDDMRSYIRSYLTGLYNIIEAANGKEGAEKAIEQIPDLIVSDLMMPFVDGSEMTRQLKSDERTSHIPIILLTAKASRETKLEGLELGADDFLTKPFDTEELLVRIKNLVEQRRKLRALLSKHLGDSKQTSLIRESSGKLISKLDEKFLEKATFLVREHMSNPEFSVDMLAREMSVSRMQLHRKLTGLTDHSASDLIRNIRLMHAARLLKEGELNVTEITYEIGISSQSNFSKIFKEKYGVSPSEYH
ncbi:MAG: response regulator [Bacteroidales bacterium]|nr:response regulator [Bacteroidales bacterium]MCF8405428.1 response regulator [Bacteroidales bacterium]